MIFDRFFRLSESPGVGVRCSGQGLFVGSTPLLESVPAHNGRAEWRVRRADAIARDLSKNYGMPVAVSAKMPGPAIFSIVIGTPQSTRDGPLSALMESAANLRLLMVRQTARTPGPPATSRLRLRSRSPFLIFPPRAPFHFPGRYCRRPS